MTLDQWKRIYHGLAQDVIVATEIQNDVVLVYHLRVGPFAGSYRVIRNRDMIYSSHDKHEAMFMYHLEIGE